MITFAEFEIAVLGLLRLARFDSGFAGFFDLSARGARRSFGLALPLLPIVLLLMHLNARWPEGTDMTRVVAAELIGYVLMWTCFPLLLFGFARVIEREGRIYGAIAVYNWLSVLSIGLQLPIAVAAYLGLSAGWAGAMSDIALIFVIACEFFAFRRLLEIRIEMTIALVVVDFILGQIVQTLIYGLAHGQLI
jgi:hypothetical protein